jgi:hypothetical protein
MMTQGKAWVQKTSSPFFLAPEVGMDSSSLSHPRVANSGQNNGDHAFTLTIIE